MVNLQDWLTNSPNITTFRINKLKKFDITFLKTYLETQSQELGIKVIPNIYILREDCLVVEKWPNDLVVEKSGNEVIVDVLCAAAVLKGAHVFAPGVLGLPSNIKLEERVDVYADLDGQCKRGLKVKYEGRKLYIGTGFLKMQRYHLFENGAQPRGIAVRMLLPASNLPVINEEIYPEGHILLQNLPSIVVGWVINAKPNEYILDMCAAPGNKTTHLGEMSDNKALIYAIDKSDHKTNRIIKNLTAHGINCVKVFSYDSVKCYFDSQEEEVIQPPFPLNSFDKVLLDAPCSGLGQRPQLVNKMSPKILQSYKFVQRKLFNAAVKVLKVNGILVYSTCTIIEEENEMMVAWVLEKYPNLQLVPAEPLLGGPGLANLGLNDEQRIMVQRFGPENDVLRIAEDIYKNSIGFFIAKFIKTN
ncbi:tRNA (cytosine(72)-C(5))-methyltransferase NSUN6 [Battus philenor]|uniref:tRNA (cytosine(72)-C(5))-methyltransferase NSUN6 n=1 Tax=Battus philenor TaxID=42288 RepID=UPI0035D0E351